MRFLMDGANCISFLSLIIAILATFAASLIAYMNRQFTEQVNKVREEQKKICADHFFLTNIAEHTSKCFIVLDSIINTQQVVLRRMLEKDGLSKDQVNTYVQRYKEMRRRFLTFFQTLLIYSHHSDWKKSAFNQLSEDLGTAETLRRLIELQKHEQDLAKDLEATIRDLETRINESLESTRS